MGKTYNQFDIDVAFDVIWEFWPNKEKEHAGKKALSVLLKSGDTSFEQIRDACRAYALSSEGDEFTYQLNNFINQDLWKDVLEHTDLAKLEAKRKESISVIDAWNAACKPHWCKSMDYTDKISLTNKALNDKMFNANWKKALDKASKIFAKPFREDSKQKLILSLRWFCNVSPAKHTVMRIIEGEYGYPERDSKKKVIEFRQRTKEEIEEFKKNWAEIKLSLDLHEDNRKDYDSGDPFELH